MDSARGYWAYLSITMKLPSISSCPLAPLPEYVIPGTCSAGIPSGGDCQPRCSTRAEHDSAATCGLEQGLLIGEWKGFCACDEGLHFVNHDTPGSVCSPCPAHSTIVFGNVSTVISDCVCDEGYHGTITRPTDICEPPAPPPTTPFPSPELLVLILLAASFAVVCIVVTVPCLRRRCCNRCRWLKREREGFRQGLLDEAIRPSPSTPAPPPVPTPAPRAPSPHPPRPHRHPATGTHCPSVPRGGVGAASGPPSRCEAGTPMRALP